MPPATTNAGPVPQAAALCFRSLAGQPAQVLLITSRSGEWAIPKGRIDPGFTPPQAAANEALEEAGALGTVMHDHIGEFGYVKLGGWANPGGTPCHVRVFPLLVEDLLDAWLESEFRQRRWINAANAAHAVSQPGLAQVLRGFPAWLKSMRAP